jgi:hypothetical protein
LLTIGGKKRDAGEVEHGKNVGVLKLVLKRKTKDIEAACVNAGADASERMPFPSHEGFHVDPGRKSKIGHDIRLSV